jgi:mRNA interferase MazF
LGSDLKIKNNACYTISDMSFEYSKNFDDWNRLKKVTDESNRKVFGYPREVWWCSLGVNIGVEADGENENFERPVLIVKVYNKQSLLVLPLTGRARDDKFHFPLKIKELNRSTNEIFTKTVFVKLTQARVVSNKRLLRKVDVINKVDFSAATEAFREFI